MTRNLASFAGLLITASILTADNAPSEPADGVVVYAHMANTTVAVDWSMRAGANAVEMDLQFQADGTPKEFRHGGVCDCSCTDGCLFEWSCEGGNVCYVLWQTGSSCNASEDAVVMVQKLTAHTDQLAVVYIDSKVDAQLVDLAAAGQAVITLLDTHLFPDGGFKGQVVIATPTTAEIEYTQAAVDAAGESPNRANYYFTIDGEGDDFVAVAEVLVPLTDNRGFSTGISACLPGTYYDAIELSALNQDLQVVSFSSIWSLNDESSMAEYLQAGATGLMTNIPSHALAALEAEGLTLAKPGEAFEPSTSDRIVTHLTD